MNSFNSQTAADRLCVVVDDFIDRERLPAATSESDKKDDVE
jgi:hypothetical protein